MNTSDGNHFTSSLNGLQQPPTVSGGALQRYRAMAVGRKGYATLLLYELVATFILPLPGQAGGWARRLFLPWLCRSFGRQVSIGCDCTVRNPAVIEFGDRAVIGRQVCIDAKPAADRLSIGADVHIGDGSICNCAGATLEIGEGTVIGAATRIGSRLGLTIGRNCRIGVAVCLSGAAHAYDRRDIPIVLQPVTCKGPTVIGNDVVIGDRTTVLDGVRIGDRVRIAPDSLVISDIPADLLVSGVPVRIPEERG
jgi:acetyltransferase-like isoleucine patch superfamily enzyme